MALQPSGSPSHASSDSSQSSGSDEVPPRYSKLAQAVWPGDMVMGEPDLKRFIKSEMPQVLKHRVQPDVMDVVFNPNVLPSVSADFYPAVLQVLVDQCIFAPENSCAFNPKIRTTHHGLWQTAPKLRCSWQEFRSEYTGMYDKLMADFITEIKSVIYSVDVRLKQQQGYILSNTPREFHDTSSSPFRGAGQRKPDLVLVDRSNPPPLHDFKDVLSVLQIKYQASEKMGTYALHDFIDSAWFMFDQQDQRRYVLGGTICGPMLTICLVDHGGAIATVEVDIEQEPLVFIEFLTVLLMGNKEILGFELSQGESDTLPIGCGLLSLRLVARVFSQRALTGRCTKVFIAKLCSALGDSPIASPSFMSQASVQPQAQVQPTSPMSPSAMPTLSTTPMSLTESVASSDLPSKPLDNSLPTVPQLDGVNEVAVKDSWPSHGQLPEGYILDQLAAGNGAQFAFNHGFPTKILDEYLNVFDPVEKKTVIDSTSLHRRNVDKLIPYEARHHYRLVLREIILPVIWFGTKKEFFQVILTAIQAHRFAAEVRKILHRDVSPWNIWIFIARWEALSAIPDWPDEGQPTSRPGLLGDWGLAIPLDGFVSHPTVAQIPEHIAPHDAWVAGRDRTGTLPFMATELLWDEHGYNVLHQPHHDLESFFWVILWCMCNLYGPYHSLRSWADEEITHTGRKSKKARKIKVAPPDWLRWDRKGGRFRDVLISRMEMRGDFQSKVVPLIHPFWDDPAVIEGVGRLFDMYLPMDLVKPRVGEVDMNFPRDPFCTYDQFVDVLNNIISSVGPDETPVLGGARTKFLSSFQPTSHYRLPSGSGSVMLELNAGSVVNIASAEVMFSEPANRDSRTKQSHGSKKSRGGHDTQAACSHGPNTSTWPSSVPSSTSATRSTASYPPSTPPVVASLASYSPSASPVQAAVSSGRKRAAEVSSSSSSSKIARRV